MPRVTASRELLSSREEVWHFLAEPHHLPDWWPGVAGVEPDRRGLAAGARWQVRGINRPSLFRAPNPSGTLVVLAADAPARFAFHLTGERVDAELELAERGPDRTLATLTVEGPWLIGLGRSYPRKALDRLHALVQFAEEL